MVRLRRMAGRVKRRLRPDPSPPRDIADYLARPLPHQKKLLELLPGDAARVVFDVGACEGEDSIRYRDMFPSADVYACEPLPKNLHRISENLRRYGGERITIIPRALSDHSGSAEFHVSSGRPDTAGEEEWDYGNKSSSLLPPAPSQLQVHDWLRFEERITVETTTLADVMTEHAIDRIDFMHMDVQGAELMVLRGAGDRLADIGAIWLEVEAVELYQDQPLRPDVESFMVAAGFELVMDTVDEVSGDQLYVNPLAPRRR